MAELAATHTRLGQVQLHQALADTTQVAAQPVTLVEVQVQVELVVVELRKMAAVLQMEL